MTAKPSVVIVEETGDPAEIEGALARAEDLGTVVLAAQVAEGEAMVDLYADLHVRGLTLLTAPPDDG